MGIGVVPVVVSVILLQDSNVNNVTIPKQEVSEKLIKFILKHNKLFLEGFFIGTFTVTYINILFGKLQLVFLVF